MREFAAVYSSIKKDGEANTYFIVGFITANTIKTEWCQYDSECVNILKDGVLQVFMLNAVALYLSVKMTALYADGLGRFCNITAILL